MATSDSMRDAPDGWRRAALRYAEQYGWPVAPLHPGAEGEIDDPILEHLGHRPLVDIPEGASAQPDVIRGWTGIPQYAPLGLLTGADAQVAALEIPDPERTTLTSADLQRLQEVLPDTRRIDGPERTYHLFSFPSEVDLPAFTPFSNSSDGLVLHGEQSVIRIPRSVHARGTYCWDWTSPDAFAPFPESLLSFFGVRVDVEALRDWQETLTSASLADSPSSSSGDEEGLTFRSGAQLDEASEESSSDVGIPWLARGAVSVLSGPPKTAGKSTFVVNLAAHLAAGRSFLGCDVRPTSVVMWSDLPARRFRECLQRTGIGPEARARLHVLHPRDAARHSWQGLLGRTFDHARHEDAGVILLDSLDQFVQVKGDVDPTASAELAHVLTTEAPAACAVLAVKALRTPVPVRMDEVVERLGLLGTAADLVLQMDRGPTGAHPTLRRLQCAGRLHPVPSHLLCELVRGRYRRLPSEEQTEQLKQEVSMPQLTHPSRTEAATAPPPRRQ